MKPRIEALRRRSERAMPDECEVIGTKRVSDGRGGYITTTTVLATVRCRLSGLSADEEAAASRISSVHTAKASVPADTTISSANSLKIGAPGSASANKVPYNITGVMPGSQAHAPHLEVLVARSS